MTNYINADEPITIYAICLFGWGKGKTIAEALRNCRKASRGYLDEKFSTVEKDGKRKTEKDIADLLDEQKVRLYASNETDGIAMEWYTPKPSKGKWVLFLGDCMNEAQFFGNPAIKQ